MNLEIFSVYDSKMESFIPPFFQLKIDAAKRVFSNAAKDKGHVFGANPADYTLFHIGTFDDQTGEIKRLKTPKSLGLAQEYLVQVDIQEDIEDDIDEIIRANAE